VIKYSPAGGATDAVMLGSSGDDVPSVSRMGADGYLYVAGRTVNGNITGVGSNALFSSWVAKIDPQHMAVVWLRQLGDVDNQATGLAIAPDGSIYVSGYTIPGVATNAAGGNIFQPDCADTEALGTRDCADVMLSKYSPDGTQQWVVVDRHPGMQSRPRVAVTPNGQAVVVASTRCDVLGSLTECDANLEKTGVNNKRVRHLMAAMWVYAPDGSGGPVRNLKYDKCDVGVSSVASDLSGNPTFTGTTTCTASPFSNNPGGWAFFVMQTDLSGNTLWANTWAFGDTTAASVTVDDGPIPFNTRGNTAANGIVRGASGEFYVTFSTAGSTFAPLAGGSDAVVMRLDSSGGLTWGRQFGSAGDELAASVSVDPFGNVFAAGSTTGLLDSRLNAAYGGRDLYVVKLSPSAVIQK